MYGHMITKLPGMGRFTYPLCSVGECFVHARALLLVKRKCKKRKKTEAFKDDVAKNVEKKLINSKKKYGKHSCHSNEVIDHDCKFSRAIM